MAIGAIARGDLVAAYSSKLGIQGLFVVDSVNGNLVKAFDLAHAGSLASADKTGDVVLDKTTDVLAVITASSISA
jgi:hypothetical protein